MKKILKPIIMFCILFLGGLLTRYSVDHQQLYIAVIASTLLFVAGYCMGYKENIQDYEIKAKSKKDIQRNVTICIQDNEYTAEHLDDDKNIIAFMTFHPNNINYADFYYSLFDNKQIINIIYKNENNRIYYAVITQIKLIDENTLRIYYTVLNNYVQD